MNKNFSGEQLDQILQKIVKDSLLNEDAINEIADSPQLRWNVQRRIEQEKPHRKKSWLAMFNRRLAAFVSLAFVVCAGTISFINFDKNDSVAAVKPIDLSIAETSKANENVDGFQPKIEGVPKVSVSKNLRKTSPKKFVSTNINSKLNVEPKPQIKEIKQNKPTEARAKNREIKTDFIALAYSSAPESGQILKVKVPRSMMVSLGVAMTVENNSELVNAEVLMGDDGLARAIRFTR